ncbi:MAG: dehydratase [Pelagibacterium sp. SCN 64-44]|nr:MAG: dehydratase [Pelagibacterium sp. SCN 64-44]
MDAQTVFLDGLVGTAASFVKQIGESDLLDFARVTGDSHPNHTDEAYAVAAGLGGRVAQGSLMVGLIAGASTQYLTQLGRPAVSYGYERVRFLKLVHIGDRLTVDYRIVEVDPAKSNASAQARISNQDGDLVAVGINILHFT